MSRRLFPTAVRGGRGRTHGIVSVLLLLALAPVTLDQAQVVLDCRDGSKLKGKSVRQEGDFYILEGEGDSLIPIPADLVMKVTLGTQPEAAKPADRPASGVVEDAEAQLLAGTDVPRPTSSDPRGTLGPPATFKQGYGPAPPEPRYWTMDPDQHNFNPVEWTESAVDPSWEPTPAYDPEADVLAEGRVEWKKPIKDSSWAPEDGFAKSQADRESHF